MKLAHIVNPYTVEKNSSEFLAYLTTFETMRIARKFASEHIEVELWSAQYHDDQPAVPTDFSTTKDLERSVTDVAEFSKKRRLPILADILDRLYSASDADYLIYTNVDIALQPYFYNAVANYIDFGFDALVINRRTIPDDFKEVSEIPRMWTEIGQPHPGWDCFVFPRQHFPKYRLGTTCIGAWRVGLVLLTNMLATANNFLLLEDAHLTFHLGYDRSWKKNKNHEYEDHNTKQLLQILAELEDEYGFFSPSSIPGSFLRRKRLLGPLYDIYARNILLPRSLSRLLNRLIRS